MTESDAREVYARFAVKVKHAPTKAVTCHIPKNGVLRPNQRPIPGHVVTTRQEYFAKVALVRAAVAILDAHPPVETPVADAHLSFLAA